MRNTRIFTLFLVTFFSCGCTSQNYGKIIFEDSICCKKPTFYNASLTWRNYNSISDAGNELYIWNGGKIGQGKAGFLNVLNHMASMPKYSSILMYPRSKVNDNLISGEIDKNIAPIYLYQFDRMEKIVKERSLALVWLANDGIPENIKILPRNNNNYGEIIFAKNASKSKYDAVFTWIIGETSENYFWNDKKLNSGLVGFKLVIYKLNQMKKGSVILGRPSVNKNNKNKNVPFEKYLYKHIDVFNSFFSAMNKKKLKVIILKAEE